MKKGKLLLTALFVAAATLFSLGGTAEAHARFFFGFNFGPPVFYAPPVVVAPPPVYYRPYYRPYYYPGDYYRPYGYTYYAPAPAPVYEPAPRLREQYGYLWTQIEPNFAEVYVDGIYSGRVRDYDGPVNHMPLPPGRHRVEFRAHGYMEYRVDVYISPGVTTSVENDLEAYRR